jgi:hypothetical protein
VTLPELAEDLAPITDDALTSEDADVALVSTVLAAVMGCIAGESEPDRDGLRALAQAADRISEERLRRPGVIQ